MKMIKAALAVAMVALFAGQAIARPPVYFKAPVKARGTGCPGPNSFTVTGENTDTMTILFDQFDAAKPKENAASGMMRTSCNFVVPVHVPPGLQVSNLTADWRGYAEGRTKLRREYFFAGQKGPKKTTSPKGDFVERDNLQHATWAACGANVAMRINSSVRAMSRNSYIAVDTLDLNKNRIVFHLKWRKCR